MVYTSTQALQNSLPNRSPSQRPRSLSLSEYQPLTFDREATALAYRNQLHQPVSSTTTSSSYGHGYSTSSNSHGPATADTTAQSSLSHHLRRGDNPHSPIRASDSSPIDIPGGGPFFGANNFAGVGAGHSLTPPQSPIHQAVQQAHRASLNLSAGVSGSSLEDSYVPPGTTPSPPGLPVRPADGRSPGSPMYAAAPQLPRRPSALPESTYPAVDTRYMDEEGRQPSRQRRESGSGIQRPRRPSWLSPEDFGEGGDGASTVDGTGMGTVAGSVNGRGRGQAVETAADGWESDPGYPRYIGGRHGGRRELPAVPTNVPAPEPPGWEPDYKPHIPNHLTQSSVEHAYAQLSAPPPGLPPRRAPPRLYTIASTSTLPNNGASSSSQYSETPLAGPVGSAHPGTLSADYAPQTPIGNIAPPPPGAPSFPVYALPSSQPKPRRPAEESVVLKADGRTPIWSTHYLDPCLRNPLINIPSQVSGALSGLAKDPATSAQMDRMARMAKGWFVPPDGKFSTDKGAIELGLGVIDCGGREGEEGWGREKGRRKARVEVWSRVGGVKLDLIELGENRQVDLKIETKAGDVVLLLPQNFIGSINITKPGPDPHFCAGISSALAPVNHPYDTVYTTFVTPSSATSGPSSANGQRGLVGSLSTKKQRWVPEFLRPAEGEAALVGEWSKVTIVTHSSKARVVLGYRDSGDEVEAKSLGVMVGMEGQEKKRRWWR